MVSKRLGQYIDYKGISFYEFENRIKSSRGAISKAVKEGKSIGSQVVENILRVFKDLNPEWLMTGAGQMIKGNEGGQAEEPGPTYKPQGKKVPLVKIEAVAGFGSSDWSIQAKDIQADYVVPDFNGIDFMIRVKGSSMYPKYNSGDVIGCRIIRESNFIQWNKPYVIATREQGIMVKRLHPGSNDQSLKAVSDNQDYPPFEIPRDEITGVALIVGVIRLE